MAYCSNCGMAIEEGKMFCRHCGTSVLYEGEEAPTSQLPSEPEPGAEQATWHLPAGPSPDSASNAELNEEYQTWRLPSGATPNAEQQRPTMPVNQGATTPQAPPQGNPYLPPVQYYQPPPPPMHYQPPPSAPRGEIRLGDWLSNGWRVYSENWLVMSLATLTAVGLSIVTFGILAGPLIMGLYRMAFKTMRGERPVFGDMFAWEGRFVQAFLSFLVFAAIYVGFTAGGRGGFLSVLAFLVVNPILTIGLSFVMPLILERNVDAATAVNSVGRMLFARDKLMWWVAGLVLFFINFAGATFCGVGALLTLPWTISAAAVAYRQIYGIDDPNRTLH